MNKGTAGVLTGFLLGAIYGLVSAWGSPRSFDLFLAALARASQGVINGVLVAYLTGHGTPLWRGALVGVLLGAALGFVAGMPGQSWSHAVPWSAAVGLGCGLAVARASRAAH